MLQQRQVEDRIITLQEEAIQLHLAEPTRETMRRVDHITGVILQADHTTGAVLQAEAPAGAHLLRGLVQDLQELRDHQVEVLLQGETDKKLLTRWANF